MVKGIVENIENRQYIGQDQEQLLDQQDSDTDQVITSPSKPAYIKNDVDDRFQSTSLPSGFKFYDFDSIMIRKFEIRDLSKMYQVVTTGSYSLFKQVIQGCINVDVDLLTPGDFKWICYWLRANSYPKTPIHVEWVSKYGNKCVSTVTKDQITTLAMDTDDRTLEQWKQKGFVAPTLKFTDVFENGSLSEQDQFIYTNAQYFKGDTWEQKINTMEQYLNANGLEGLNDVKQWDSLIEHGVEETLTVTDLNFDPEKYLSLLKEKITKTVGVAKSLTDQQSDDYILVTSTLKALKKEYKQISDKISKGEEVRPEPETIFLEVGPYELLSPILTKSNHR